MRGIVNWYSDRKKQGLIEGQTGENVMVYEEDISFLTLLHAADYVEYTTVNFGINAPPLSAA